jgi:DNA-binding MarR family transcriptional regulator
MRVPIEWSTASRHSGPEDSPGFLLWRVSLEWRRSIERALAPLELTQPQFVVLAGTGWLTRNGDAVRQTDIGRHIGVDPNTLSQILRGLEKRKLVSRRQLSRGSGKYPRLTQTGQNALRQALPLAEDVDQRFFGVLGADVTMAMAVLTRLFAALSGQSQMEEAA